MRWRPHDVRVAAAGTSCCFARRWARHSDARAGRSLPSLLRAPLMRGAVQAPCRPPPPPRCRSPGGHRAAQQIAHGVDRRGRVVRRRDALGRLCSAGAGVDGPQDARRSCSRLKCRRSCASTSAARPCVRRCAGSAKRSEHRPEAHAHHARRARALQDDDGDGMKRARDADLARDQHSAKHGAPSVPGAAPAAAARGPQQHRLSAAGGGAAKATQLLDVQLLPRAAKAPLRLTATLSSSAPTTASSTPLKLEGSTRSTAAPAPTARSPHSHRSMATPSPTTTRTRAAAAHAHAAAAASTRLTPTVASAPAAPPRGAAAAAAAPKPHAPAHPARRGGVTKVQHKGAPCMAAGAALTTGSKRSQQLLIAALQQQQQDVPSRQRRPTAPRHTNAAAAGAQKHHATLGRAGEGRGGAAEDEEGISPAASPSPGPGGGPRRAALGPAGYPAGAGLSLSPGCRLQSVAATTHCCRSVVAVCMCRVQGAPRSPRRRRQAWPAARRSRHRSGARHARQPPPPYPPPHPPPPRQTATRPPALERRPPPPLIGRSRRPSSQRCRLRMPCSRRSTRSTRQGRRPWARRRRRPPPPALAQRTPRSRRKPQCRSRPSQRTRRARAAPAAALARRPCRQGRGAARCAWARPRASAASWVAPWRCGRRAGRRRGGRARARRRRQPRAPTPPTKVASWRLSSLGLCSVR